MGKPIATIGNESGATLPSGYEAIDRVEVIKQSDGGERLSGIVELGKENKVERKILLPDLAELYGHESGELWKEYQKDPEKWRAEHQKEYLELRGLPYHEPAAYKPPSFESDDPMEQLQQENEDLRKKLEKSESDNEWLRSQLETFQTAIDELSEGQEEMARRLENPENPKEPEMPEEEPKPASEDEWEEEPDDGQEEPVVLEEDRNEFDELRDELEPIFGPKNLHEVTVDYADYHDRQYEGIEEAEDEEARERAVSRAEQRLKNVRHVIALGEVGKLRTEEGYGPPEDADNKLERYLELAPRALETEEHNLDEREESRHDELRRRPPEGRSGRGLFERFRGRAREPRRARVWLEGGQAVTVTEEDIEYEDQHNRTLVAAAAVGAVALFGAAIGLAAYYAGHKTGATPDVLREQINHLTNKVNIMSDQFNVLRGQSKTEIMNEHKNYSAITQNHSLIESLKDQVGALTAQLQDLRERTRGLGIRQIFLNYGDGYTQAIKKAFPGHSASTYYDAYQGAVHRFGPDFIKGAGHYRMQNGNWGLSHTGTAHFTKESFQYLSNFLGPRS